MGEGIKLCLDELFTTVNPEYLLKIIKEENTKEHIVSNSP